MRDFQQPRRSPAISGEAMAATSHPLATLAAIEVLRAGGNAVDAALAAAVLLCVAEPQMTGTGGDCFVLYSPKAGLPKALNGSGRAPAKAKAEWFAERGIETIPFNSPHAVTVPGAVDAWLTLHRDYGSKDLAELFRPGIALAERGVTLTPRVAWDFANYQQNVMTDPDAAAVFAPGGNMPGLGQTLAAAGAGRDPEAHRQARPRGILRRPCRGRTSSPSSTRWAACTRSRISPRRKANMSNRSRRPIAATRCSNARPTARAWAR